MMKKINLVLLLFFSIFSLYPADKNFTFSSDSTSISLARGNEFTQLKGNARITTEDTEIRADRIELYGEDFRYARCSGDVRVVDKNQGISIRSEDLFFDREEELMIINGYAEMIDQKNEIVVKGNHFENRGKDNTTVIQIGVRILKASEEDSMTCRSEYARYSRDSDILELSGIPVVFWKEDEYRATRISINLETDEISMTGDVSGTIHSQDNEKTEDSTEAENPDE